MSNDSKFINIQMDPSVCVELEERPLDRVCPTCIPNDSYIAPDWWTQKTPWLNEKTCEYQIAVFVNQNGEGYRLSDLRGIFDPPQDTTVVISESGIPKRQPQNPALPQPTEPTAKGAQQTQEEESTTNAEMFDLIKRSFVKPGIRSLLMHYDKEMKEEYICARNDCAIFSTAEAARYVQQRVHYASINSDVTFKEFSTTGPSELIEDSLKIDNYNSLELFASATEYHFFGTTDNAMAVLVSIPAYIFDQIPQAPEIQAPGTEIETVRFNVAEFVTWVDKMEAIFKLFSKFQAYFNHTQGGKLYHYDADDTESTPEPFYCSLMEGKFENFNNKLSSFINEKGYSYYSGLYGAFSNPAYNQVLEIELKFDKSNEKRPYALADTITIKPAHCKETELKLPPSPEEGVPTLDENLRSLAWNDQTLMTYIANYAAIKTQIDAKQNPPWLDFLTEFTLPALTVSYGQDLRPAFGCLDKELEGLDDFLLDATMSFWEGWQYQYNKNNCRLLKDTSKNLPVTIGSTPEEQKELSKLIKSLEDPDEKPKMWYEHFYNTEIDGSAWDNFMSMVNPCNWRKVTLDAVQCLLGGLTAEEGMRAVFKSMLGDMTSEGLEVILSGLPADKQEEIRSKVYEEFGSIPAPWEVGYDPGDKEAAYDRKALENINQDQVNFDTAKEVEEKLKILIAERDELQMALDTDWLDLQRATGVIETNSNARIEQLTDEIASIQTLIDDLKRSMQILMTERADVERDISAARDELKRFNINLTGITLEYLQADQALSSLKEKKDRLKIEYDELKSERDELDFDQTLLKDDRKRIEEQLKGYIARQPNKEQFEQQTAARLKDLKEEIEKLENILTEAKKAGKESLKRNPNTAGFKNKTPEEQAEILKQEKEKVWFASVKEGDKVRQGTYGRLVGNVQKEVYAAYVEAILESADIQDIAKGLDNLPGSKVFGEIWKGFDCPSHTFFSPPMDEFMGTFTLGACGKGKTRPFSFPELKKLPLDWSLWDAFADSFMFGLKKAGSQIISALIYKVLQLVNAGICKSLASVGEGAKIGLGLAPKPIDAQDFIELIDMVLCTDQLDNQEAKEDNLKELFAFSGAAIDSSENIQKVIQTMSTLGSESDYLKCMAGNPDLEFIVNISQTLRIVHPEYGDLFTPDGLNKLFLTCGNFFTPEQRAYALETTAAPITQFPLDPSICLTNEEAEEYYEELSGVYENQIGDKRIAEEFVAKQKDKIKSDLAQVAEVIAKGPEGILQDAIDDLLSPPDPDCAVNKSLLKDPKEVEELKQKMLKGMFAPLQKAFLDDTVEENMFENFFGTDSVGILLMICADIVGYNYAQHMRVRNEPFFNLLARIGIYDWKAPFPDTVALYMRDQLIVKRFLAGTQAAHLRKYNDSSIFLSYNNNMEEDTERLTSEIGIIETYPITTSNVEIHNNNFNYYYCDHVNEYGDPKSKKFIVDIPMLEEDKAFYSEFEPLDGEISFLSRIDTFDHTDIRKPKKPYNSYRNHVLKNYIMKILNNITKTQEVSIDEKNCYKILKSVNQTLFNNFSNSLLSDETGNISNGFLHGGKESILTIDDFTYVDPTPGATSYTFPEEEGVIGKSLTDNPRVQFLDPVKYGGSYTLPMIKINESNDAGWVGFSKLVIPNITGCDEKTSDFLELENLEKEVGEIEQKITPNEKLEESPDCLIEIPFEKIASPATLATLEVIIKATIRIYLTEFMVNSFSIHSNLALNNKNYDELLYEYIVEKMEDGLSNQTSFWAFNRFGTYEGYTYWLLFLEQCAQSYKRALNAGEIPSDLEADAAMEKINEAQNNYKRPDRGDKQLYRIISKVLEIDYEDRPETVSEFLREARQAFLPEYAYAAVGGHLIDNNTKDIKSTFKKGRKLKDGSFASKTIMHGFGFYFWTQSQMTFAAKVATIAENEEACKVFLKRLIRREVEHYSDKLALEMNPRPLIYDINKFFLGASKTFYGDNIRAGLYDVEVPIGEVSGLPDIAEVSNNFYGTINHCAKSDGVHTLLDKISQNEKTHIAGHGGFYLEKYLRITPKGAPRTRMQDEMTERGLKSPLEQESEKHKTSAEKSKPNEMPSDVQNINEFIEFLNTQDIPPDVNISDWFGNAEITNSEKGYNGDIGIKFGVRICYMPVQDFEISLYDAPLETFRELSLKERTFLHTDTDTLTSSKDKTFSKYIKLSIPLVSYEKDILDNKLASFKEASEDFNQDIKCFIDGLVNTKEFDLVFNKIFNIKKVGSIMSIYSDKNFISSIGLGEGERREEQLEGIFGLFSDPPELPDSDDRGNSFNDSKHNARRIFVSNWNRNDFDPPDEEDNVDEMSLLIQSLLAKSFAGMTIDYNIPWSVKQRIISAPPEDCENQFGALMKIDDPSGIFDYNNKISDEAGPESSTNIPELPSGTGVIPEPEVDDNEGEDDDTGGGTVPEDKPPSGPGGLEPDKPNIDADEPPEGEGPSGGEGSGWSGRY